MATLTNVGLYGNGRSFEYLLIKMLASKLSEIHNLGNIANEELRKVIPAFVKRSTNSRGTLYQDYLHKTFDTFQRYSNKIKEKKTIVKQEKNTVVLTSYDKNPIDKIVSHILFSYTDSSLKLCEEQVKKMSMNQKQRLIKDLTKNRQNRHHKMGRALENTFYTVEIVSDIGAFRDLHRHRMLTQERQHYTTALGYIMPKEIKEAGLVKQYLSIMEKADVIYKTIAKDFPLEAQYVVPFAYRIRYYFTLNLREAIHLTELRATPQGHASYRYIAQEIAKAIGKVHPYFKPLFQFVDYKEYKLERLDAFKKIEEKAQKMGSNHFEK
jgi:thymidylate synthase ThyX